MFSNLSFNSISLATVTPSFVITGAPKDFSIATLQPFGPKVTLTASDKIRTQRAIDSLALLLKRSSLLISHPSPLFVVLAILSDGLFDLILLLLMMF